MDAPEVVTPFELKAMTGFITTLVGVVTALIVAGFKREIGTLRERIDAETEARDKALFDSRERISHETAMREKVVEALMEKIKYEKLACDTATAAIIKRIEVEVKHRDDNLNDLERESLSLRTRVHEMTQIVTGHSFAMDAFKETQVDQREAVKSLKEAVQEIRLFLESLKSITK